MLFLYISITSFTYVSPVNVVHVNSAVCVIACTCVADRTVTVENYARLEDKKEINRETSCDVPMQQRRRFYPKQSTTSTMMMYLTAQSHSLLRTQYVQQHRSQETNMLINRIVPHRAHTYTHIFRVTPIFMNNVTDRTIRNARPA